MTPTDLPEPNFRGDEAFRQRACELARRFEASPKAGRFILGTGDYAKSVAAHLPIGGFIDDFTSASHVDGSPVVRTTDIPDQAVVLVASMLRPLSASASLDKLGVPWLSYFEYADNASIPLLPVSHWSAFRPEYAEHYGAYRTLLAQLADDESRNTLANIIRFRLSGDLAYMRDFRYDPFNQYFEPFLQLRPTAESFVDVGGFDGATSLRFAEICPRFDEITLMEPDPSNFEAAMALLTEALGERVTGHMCGLSSRAATVPFANGLGSTSAVVAEGETTIHVIRLDDLQLERATFLKMDIEGMEIPALAGARGTILRLRPRLAIAAYHHAPDLRTIPQVIGSFGIEGGYFLRHYTEGIDETILFFVPA